MNATTWVGIGAIVVSAIFNLAALRRAGKTLKLAEDTYLRTEQRYQDDRRDAYYDNLRDALIDVSGAVATWNVANAWYVKLLKDIIGGSATAGAAQEHDVEKLRPGARDVYRTVRVVEFLSADERLTPILQHIEQKVLAGMKLVQGHNLSVNGVLAAEKKFNELRSDTAKSATELLQVAREVIPHRQPPSRDDSSLRSIAPQEKR